MRAILFAKYLPLAIKIHKNRDSRRPEDPRPQQMIEERKVDDDPVPPIEVEVNAALPREELPFGPDQIRHNHAQNQGIPIQPQIRTNPMPNLIVQAPSPAYSSMSIESQGIMMEERNFASFTPLMSFIENINEQLHSLRMQQASIISTLNVLTHDLRPVNEQEEEVHEEGANSRGRGRGRGQVRGRGEKGEQEEIELLTVP